MSLTTKELEKSINEARQKLNNIRYARRTLDTEEDALLFEVTKHMQALDVQSGSGGGGGSGSGIRGVRWPSLVVPGREICMGQKVKVLGSRMSKDNGKIGVVVKIGKMVTVQPDHGGRLIVRASKNLESCA